MICFENLRKDSQKKEIYEIYKETLGKNTSIEIIENFYGNHYEGKNVSLFDRIKNKGQRFIKSISTKNYQYELTQKIHHLIN